MSDENEKLKALMVGLEIPLIDKFIDEADVDDYRELGRLYASKAKTLTLSIPTADEVGDVMETLLRRDLLKPIES